MQSTYSISPTGSNFILTLITNLVLAALGMLSGIILARWLGPTGRGELALIQLWPTFLAVVCLLGLPEALVYYSAQDSDKAGRWLITAIVAGLLLCIPFMILGYIYIPWLLNAQPSEIIKSSQSYLWLLPLMATVGMMVHPLRGRNDIRNWNIVRSFPSQMWIIVIIILVLVGIKNASVFAKAYLVGFGLLIIPVSYIVYRKIPGGFKPNRKYLSPLFSYGIPAVLSVLPYTLNVRLDQMVMARILDSERIGFYVVAVSWSGIIAPFTGALPAILLPRVAGIVGEKEKYQILGQMVRIGVIISMLVAIFFAMISPLGIHYLFGLTFSSSIPSAVLLSLAAGFLGINHLLHSGAMSLGKPKYVLISEFFGLLMTMVLLWFLLPILNIIGAAIASLISYFLVGLVLLILIKNHTKLNYPDILVLKQEDLQLIKSKLLDLCSTVARKN